MIHSCKYIPFLFCYR